MKRMAKMTYKGRPIRTTADFNLNQKIRKNFWTELFKNLKYHNCKPVLIYKTFYSNTKKRYIFFLAPQ